MRIDVVRFSVETKFWGIKHDNINEIFVSCYKNRAENYSDYESDIQKKWNELKETNLKALHESKNVKAWADLSSLNYFIIDRGNSGDKNKRTYEIILKSESKKAEEVVNQVLKDIKSKVKDKRIRVNLVKDRPIYIHPYDFNNQDVLETFFVIKATNIERYSFNKREIVLMIIAIVTVLLFSFSDEDMIFAGVKESIIASALVYIFTSLITNLNFFSKLTPEKLGDLYEIKQLDRPNQLDQIVNKENETELEDPEI